ncbi:hypothetical protein ACWF9G_27245 [Nocardia sp. NPDC055029]
MFENWPVTFTPSPWRIIDPPQKVMVAAHLAIATKPKHFRQDKLAMRVKLGGLRLADNVPGWLYAWVLLADGTWMGLCTFTLVTGNGHGQLQLHQWCPAHALSPAE